MSNVIDQIMRGGKSFALSLVAVFLAAFKDWKPYLGPGEVATIMILAKDRAQARSIKRFISGLLRETPSAPAASYDYNRNSDWKNYVRPDGSIRSRRGPWSI